MSSFPILLALKVIVIQLLFKATWPRALVPGPQSFSPLREGGLTALGLNLSSCMEQWGQVLSLLQATWPSSVGYVCQLLSRVRLLETPWTVARQAPLSTEFSWQEDWSG